MVLPNLVGPFVILRPVFWPLGGHRDDTRGELRMALNTQRIIGAALSLILVLTAPALALSRTAPNAAGTMVICTGSGPLSIVVDSDGQPIDHIHICPECAFAALSAVLPDLVQQPVYMPRVLAAGIFMAAVQSGAARVPAACARAPPCGAQITA